MLGIKQWSRVTEYGSSYTLVEHASDEALQLEIMPRAIEEVRKVRKAWDDGDYEGLLRVLGKSEEDATFDMSFDPEALEGGNNSPSEEWEPAEAVLLADKSGNSIRFPYVSNQINRKLARWAFRTLTSGGFKLPAFALSDDGILVEHEARYSRPRTGYRKTTAITSVTAEQSLCIRYPIRMQEDLLPVRHIADSELVPMLARALGKSGQSELPEPLIAYILKRQLRMEGTYICIRRRRSGMAATSTSIPSVPCRPTSFRSSLPDGSRMERDSIRRRPSSKRRSLPGGTFIWLQ